MKVKKPIKPTKQTKPKSKWEDNSIQFPRLIAEIEMAGGFNKEIINDLCNSMDLTEDEVFSIVDRACAEWDKIKEKI